MSVAIYTASERSYKIKLNECLYPRSSFQSTLQLVKAGQFATIRLVQRNPSLYCGNKGNVLHIRARNELIAPRAQMGNDATVYEIIRKTICWISSSDLVDNTIRSLINTICEEKPTLPDREFLVWSRDTRAVRKSNFVFSVLKLVGVYSVCATRQG